MIKKTDPLKSLLDIQINMIKKPASNAPKLYVLQGNKSAWLFWSLSSAFFLIGDKIAIVLKDENIPSLKENGRLRFSTEVTVLHAREKVKL